MSTLLGTDADETILPGDISPSVISLNGPLVVGADPDVIIAGGGNDTVNGGGGNDTMLLGSGDDRAIWNPGDGSDVVDGGTGSDVMEFNGSAGNEAMRLSTLVDGTVQLTRDLGNINMTLQNMERVIVNAGDGNDTFDATGNLAPLVTVTVAGGAGNDRILGSNGNDLLFGGEDDDFIDGQQGADVAFLGAGNDVFQWDPGDGSDVVDGGAGTDTMVFNGSAASETFTIAANGQRESFRRDVGNIVMDIDSIERIETRAGAGDDTIDASALAGRAQLQLFGDDGDDLITAGAGADFINGGRGTDTVNMGAGNDRFQWNPGEGSDVIDGQAGNDTHEFNGSGAAEVFTLAAGGRDTLLTRNVGNIVMDQANVERVELFTAGGADDVRVGDLRGTDVREVRIDLAGAAGDTAGDGVADRVSFEGTSRGDVLSVVSLGDDLAVNGLAVRARASNVDATDTFTVNAGAGKDFADASRVAAGVGHVVLDGGAGNDTLIAGRGGSTLLGGTGNDLLIGGAGDDELRAGDGRDILVGKGGDDLFAGDGDFTIVGFRAGADSDDRIDLRGLGFDDFSDVMAHARLSRAGAVLDFGEDEITLLGVNVHHLHADDFLI